MKHALLLAVVLAALTALPLRAAEVDSDVITFETRPNRLAITVGEVPFAEYVFRDPKTLRPYLTHVHAPNGQPVTRNHPPIAGQDAVDHDTLHPGIWLAFGDLSGADFWRNKAVVEHAEFVEPPKSDAGTMKFAVRNVYRAGDKTICRELCRMTILPLPISSTARGTVVIWDSEFSGDEDFYFGDQEEMGLGIRLATPLTVKNGGKMTNSDGLVNEKQVWGKQAAWCDYSGTINGEPLGMLVVPDPKNFRRSWFHARDYGFLAANPFGQKAFTGSDPSKVTVVKGKTLRLRYAVLIHSGPLDLKAAASDALMRLENTR